MDHLLLKANEFFIQISLYLYYIEPVNKGHLPINDTFCGFLGCIDRIIIIMIIIHHSSFSGGNYTNIPKPDRHHINATTNVNDVIGIEPCRVWWKGVYVFGYVGSGVFQCRSLHISTYTEQCTWMENTSIIWLFIALLWSFAIDLAYQLWNCGRQKRLIPVMDIFVSQILWFYWNAECPIYLSLK